MSTLHAAHVTTTTATTTTTMFDAIAALARELRDAQDFSSPLATFEEIVQRDDFLRTCRITTSPLLDQIVTHLGARIVSPRARWRWLPGLLRHEGGKLVHGAAQIADRVALVFYFEGHDVGLATLVRPGSSEVHYARFTAVVSPPGTVTLSQRGAA